MKPVKSSYLFLSTIFIGSLLSSCALFKATPSIEIIYPPKIDDDLKTIPKLEISNDFQRLKESDSISENLEIGRENPFLSPQFDSSAINMPKGLILHGIIEANNKLTALVSYDLLSGSVEVGDTGGANTDLIPKGWSVKSIQLDEKALNLIFKNKIIRLELENI